MQAQELTLRDYQEGMRAFAGRTKFCALWADMGLGKTPTALMAVHDSLFDYCDTDRWLVVGPKLVALDTWPRQLRMWKQFAGLTWRNIGAQDFGLEPLAIIEVDGVDVEVPWSKLREEDKPNARRVGLTFGGREDKAAVKRALRAMSEQVHLCSWDFLPWLVKAYGKNWPYQGVILDEAIFVQNSTTDRHRAVWHVTQNLKAVSRMIQLTGAPNPNGYGQLHGQIRLLDGGLRLGKTKEQFTERWLMPDKVDKFRGRVHSWKLVPGAKPQIDTLLQDLCVSLKSSDYLSLPELVHNTVHVSLPDAARDTYTKLEDDLVTQIDGAEVLAPTEAALADKLMQVANGAVYDSDKVWRHVHDAKLDKLCELVDGADGPVLLAYSFESDWERIAKRLGSKAVHVKSRGSLDRFRAGKVKLLGMHPASGAHGLDGLQNISSTAIWFGATYNADHWLQFNKRLHRDGQRAGRVIVHQLIAADTIEEYVSEAALVKKLNGVEALLYATRMRNHARQC